MPNETYKIAGIGEALWDVHGDHYTFGGAPANVACHCQSLGASAFVVSCVGNDELGAKAISFLRENGVDTSCLATDSNHETGIVLIELDSSGKPTYDIRQDVAWDNIPYTSRMAELAPTLNAVCFGSLSQRSEASRSSINQFLEAMPEDSLKVFDINLRQNYYADDILLSSLNHANVLKVNDEELPILAALAGLSGDDKEQLNCLIERFNLRLAILTYGPNGALMVTPEAWSLSPSPNLGPVASTVGAGDSFTATTIIGLLNGLDLDTINQRANMVAAYVCTQIGAVPDLPADLCY